VPSGSRGEHRAPSDAQRGRMRLRLVIVVLVVLVLFVWDRLEAGSGGQPVDAAAFAPGACMAFAPTSGDRGETVFLDAGHGGIDPGGVGSTRSGRTIEEADVNLPIERDAMALLRAAGYRVVVSRTADTTVVRLAPGDVSDGELTLLGVHDDVAARARCADLGHANVLVGIYMDTSSSGNQGSLTAYDPSRSFASASLRLATLVQEDVLGAMNARGWGIPNDGVESDSGLGSEEGSPTGGGLAAEASEYNHLLLLGPAMRGFFSTPSEMPGAVIEPLYITDPFEGTIAASAAGQQTIARGIADAVEQYFH
jgi:N-acetylmuramoyl-L-alanine amidase